jgi:hypothetical protein
MQLSINSEKLGSLETKTKLRNFITDVIEPLKRDLPACAELICYGSSLSGLPLIMIKAISDPLKPAITIVAGTHGDEPAPVTATLKFVKDDLERLSKNLNIIIYPCINPDGYERDTRYNLEGLDLNREFDLDGGPKEVNAFYTSLKEWSDCIDVILNLHEDDPNVISDSGPQDVADGLYFYEHLGALQKTGFAQDLIKSLGASYAVCSRTSLYGDQLVNGVIAYGHGSANTSLKHLNLLDNFLIQHGLTARCITVETPTTWKPEMREGAQLSIIRSAISSILSEVYSPQKLNTPCLPATSSNPWIRSL